MKLSERPRFDATPALAPLRDFQRRTVDYVVERLFGETPTRRFLVADEVGLGKTMVARGVTARAIERLWDEVERIDVLYICSNGAIARQNVNRLNVLGDDAVALPTRMTLLPLRLGGARGLRANKVNFVSLTPGTTFDLKSSTGIAEERALLLRLLADREPPPAGVSEMLRVGCTPETWADWVAYVAGLEWDAELAADFRARLAADAGLGAEIEAVAARFENGADATARDDRRRRDALVGRLRGLLSNVCVAALEPDLVILDEFQRFHDLLHGDHDAAELARRIFEHVDTDGNPARTLLLSATPYRMLTLSGDDPEEGDHHADFLKTLEFLHGRERGAEIAAEIDGEMRRFRQALLGLPGGLEEARRRKNAVEAGLARVIARTERTDALSDGNSMVAEPERPLTVEPADLREAIAVSAVARAAGAPMGVEYWKSAPWLLNFMRDYALKQRLKAQAETPSSALLAAMRAAEGVTLDRAAIDAFEPLTPPNGRMRALAEDAFEGDLARRLWIPPSLPYAGAAKTATKSLVFSSWGMAPDAIAAVLSYEAERCMGVGAGGERYFGVHARRPLQFRRAQGRLAGLRALLLVVPSPTLAAAADPLEVFRESEGPLDASAMRVAIAERLRPLLAPMLAGLDREADAQTWDWAGPAFLDAAAGARTGAWLARRRFAKDLAQEEDFDAHLDALADATAGAALAGRPDPEEATALFVDLALGSPATCALRALHRVAPELALDDPGLMDAAARVAWGFRTLFNQHDAVALLRGADGEARYWREVLAYGARHELQATLDEYAHMLCEAEGLAHRPAAERVAELAERMREALSLRPAQIEVDAPKVAGGRLVIGSFHMRGRFAMRLAEGRSEDEPGVPGGGGRTRIEGVRAAFNSPFRPFVLASTSVGQEGLDFHHWCRRVHHWNLPGNPVDMEQREGRVHRYKGLAVRRNVAAAHGARLRGGGGRGLADPWAELFEAAAEGRAEGDLAPWWIHDGPAKVERRVLCPPLSRDRTRLGWLKRSVAVYRLAFGQPRQDDLLAWLEGLAGELSAEDLAALRISLRPAKAPLAGGRA